MSGEDPFVVTLECDASEGGCGNDKVVVDLNNVDEATTVGCSSCGKRFNVDMASLQGWRDEIAAKQGEQPMNQPVAPPPPATPVAPPQVPPPVSAVAAAPAVAPPPAPPAAVPQTPIPAPPAPPISPPAPPAVPQAPPSATAPPVALPQPPQIPQAPVAPPQPQQVVQVAPPPIVTPVAPPGVAPPFTPPSPSTPPAPPLPPATQQVDQVATPPFPQKLESGLEDPGATTQAPVVAEETEVASNGAGDDAVKGSIVALAQHAINEGWVVAPKQQGEPIPGNPFKEKGSFKRHHELYNFLSNGQWVSMTDIEGVVGGSENTNKQRLAQLNSIVGVELKEQNEYFCLVASQ